MANGQGEPEILCNNRGVDFTSACAGVELRDVDLYRPDLSVHGKLVPVLVHGLLSVQVSQNTPTLITFLEFFRTQNRK